MKSRFPFLHEIAEILSLAQIVKVFSPCLWTFPLGDSSWPRKTILVPDLLNINALRKYIWTVELFIFVKRDRPRSVIYCTETNVSWFSCPSSKSNACLESIVGSSWGPGLFSSEKCFQDWTKEKHSTPWLTRTPSFSKRECIYYIWSICYQISMQLLVRKVFCSQWSNTSWAPIL